VVFVTEGGAKTKIFTRWIPYLLATLPVATGFLYVYLFGVNVVVHDEWWLADKFVTLSSGTLPVGDIWEQHNEHRFFFPSIALLLLGTLTEWNTVVEMYLIQVCLLVTLFVLLQMFRINIGLKPMFFVPVAFLVFSLLQGRNMLWGLQLTFVFVETFGVLTFFFLQLSRRRGYERFTFPAALLSGTIATFSAIQGLLVWPAGLLQLFAMPLEKSKKKPLMAVWILIGVGEWIGYFINYKANSGAQSPLYPLTHPIAATRYYLTLLGNSLVSPRLESLDSVTGLLLASLVAIGLFLIYKSNRVGEYSFWLALLAFSLLILVAITAGRLGIQESAAQRYANFSVLVSISIYVILAKLALEERSHAVVALFGTLYVVVLLSMPMSYYYGINLGHALQNHREAAAFVLYNYRTQPDNCLKLVMKNYIVDIEEYASELERLGYNVFSGAGVSPPSQRIARQCAGPAYNSGGGSHTFSHASRTTPAILLQHRSQLLT
jgi:hypothetical protein